MEHTYIDEYSTIGSWVHRIHPGIKFISFVAFVLFVLSTPSGQMQKFFLFALVLFVLGIYSRIPLIALLRRSTAVIPFILIIGFFLPFTIEGNVVAQYSIGQMVITVTEEGLWKLWGVFIKAYLSIISMLLVVMSSSFAELLKALEKLRIPRIITLILSFMYRYLFVLQDEIMQMQQAKAARTVGGSYWFHTKVLANMIGMLFLRSYERAERVYLAMCSRGFTGTIRTISEPSLKIKDIAFLIVMLLVAMYIRFVIP